MKNIPLCHKCADALFALNVFCPHKSQTLMGCKRDSRINSYEKAGVLCPLLPPAIDVIATLEKVPELRPKLEKLKVTRHSAKRDVRTPEQWCEFFGVEVVDPDGWRHGHQPSWDTPITRDMFKERYQMSTCRIVDANKWAQWRHFLG